MKILSIMTVLILSLYIDHLAFATYSDDDHIQINTVGDPITYSLEFSLVDLAKAEREFDEDLFLVIAQGQGLLCNEIITLSCGEYYAEGIARGLSHSDAIEYRNLAISQEVKQRAIERGIGNIYKFFNRTDPALAPMHPPMRPPP